MLRSVLAAVAGATAVALLGAGPAAAAVRAGAPGRVGTAGWLAAAVRTAAAEPAAADPTLGSAVVDVRPAGGRPAASVREEIELTHVARGGEVRGLLTHFDGVRVTGLAITAAGQEVRPRYGGSGGVTTVSFPSPASGDLRYTVTYQVRGAPGADRVPLLVPAYAGAGGRVVTLRYHVPDGYQVRGDPFPVAIGPTGTQVRTLIGVPTFLDFELGTSPAGPVSVFTVIGVAVIVLIVALSVFVFVYEARAVRRGEIRV